MVFEFVKTLPSYSRYWKATSNQGKLFACMKASKEGMPKTAPCAVRVPMDKLRRVFLSFVKEVECKSETQAPTRNYHSTAALDPGVRTFQTIYDADGSRNPASGVKEICETRLHAERTGVKNNKHNFQYLHEERLVKNFFLKYLSL